SAICDTFGLIGESSASDPPRAIWARPARWASLGRSVRSQSVRWHTQHALASFAFRAPHSQQKNRAMGSSLRSFGRAGVEPADPAVVIAVPPQLGGDRLAPHSLPRRPARVE